MDADQHSATTGATVHLRYTIRLDDGTEYPPPMPEDRIEFELGRDRVLPGIEKAVAGMRAGDTKRVRVPAADAFGPRKPEMRFRIERGGEDDILRVGKAVRVAAPEGDFLAIVEAIDDASVLVDANHPLSGQDLTFDLEVLEVSARPREAELIA
jgi:peptidylprolyl isomerase